MTERTMAPVTTTPPTRAPNSLARTLSLRMAALVALLAIALAATSTLVVRQLQINQLDAALRDALVTQDTAPEVPKGRGPRGINQPGMPNNSILITLQDEDIVGAQLITNGKRRDLSYRQIVPLLEATSHPSTLEVESLGHFRAIKVTRTLEDGEIETTVVAVSMHRMNEAIRQLIAVELAITLVAVAAAVLLSRTWINRSLRPLQRLAQTATAVSQLHLHQGEVELAVRVSPQDADASSEVGQVGRAFNHMLNNVESALAARHRSEMKVRQFVADASHELRNPLASIRGYSELTRRRREELPADTAFAMERIESESERMSRLVEDMLLLARLDNDPALELASVDMVEVVLNSVSDARAAWPDHQWTLTLPDAEVNVAADAFRLQQVVVNLLSNARRHTPAGTLVHTSVEASDGWGVVTVTDNGPGIPAEIREHAFERFARADTARAHSSEPSTGLGLAIVAAVMQAHGGTATVTSEPGHTTFTLRFPLAA